MLEREQMSVKNVNIKLNLVGFNPDLSAKFTKQIDAINRMNVSQNRLQYHWEIGSDATSCQVHFVIESPLPHYLHHSKNPILSNQNLAIDNLIPCPHPITTFDLIDVLEVAEQRLPISQEPSKSMTFWRADGIKTTDAPPNNNTTVADNQPQDNTAEKPVFYTYGSFRKDQTETTTQTSQTNTQAQAQAQAQATNLNTPVEPELDTLPISETHTNTTSAPKETFILYGSLKNNIEQKKNNEIAMQPATMAVDATPVNDTVQSQDTLPVGTDTITSQKVEAEPSQKMHQDAWEVLSQNTTGMMWLEELNVYVNHDQKTMAAEVQNPQQMAYLLHKTPSSPAQKVNEIPNGLKQFPLPAVLWSYGLHTPKHAEQTQDFDLENYEWKLKGFPRFGQWETHPTWLFLATLFAQNHHSVYSAAMKGKASHQQILHFIYAAHLAGLTWQKQALSPSKKQEQQALSKEMTPEKASWITRLREKLHINEHFESSVD